MTVLKPEKGQILCYDFLWKDEERNGQQDGSKDRPCAIVLTRNEQPDGTQEVIVCAISHSPPKEGQGAIEIPNNVARHLNLDDGCSWIKTHEINTFTWEKDRIPVGVTKTPHGDWSYGMMPPMLYNSMRDQVLEHNRQRNLQQVKRDDDLMSYQKQLLQRHKDRLEASPSKQENSNDHENDRDN